MGRRMVDYDIHLLGIVVDNQPRYELTCKSCGGFEQDDLGDCGEMAMVYCRACRGWMGRRARLNLAAFMKAREEGVALDLNQLRAEIHRLPGRSNGGPKLMDSE
jgi:hypothetical protein